MLRVLKGWSQQDAAEACNVGQKVYWSWEIGKRYPQKNSRISISKAFGVSEDEIFTVNKQII
jgi:transcriptional regulator with XRE-family HTH domain